MASENVLIISKENFDDVVINSKKPVLIDFWAAWCGPCKMLSPIIDELGDQYSGKAKIAKINVDEQSELSSKYQIMSIPTILIFDKGNMVERMMGLRSKEALQEALDKYIK